MADRPKQYTLGGDNAEIIYSGGRYIYVDEERHGQTVPDTDPRSPMYVPPPDDDDDDHGGDSGADDSGSGGGNNRPAPNDDNPVSYDGGASYTVRDNGGRIYTIPESDPRHPRNPDRQEPETPAAPRAGDEKQIFVDGQLVDSEWVDYGGWGRWEPKQHTLGGDNPTIIYTGGRYVYATGDKRGQTVPDTDPGSPLYRVDRLDAGRHIDRETAELIDRTTGNIEDPDIRNEAIGNLLTALDNQAESRARIDAKNAAWNAYARGEGPKPPHAFTTAEISWEGGLTAQHAELLERQLGIQFDESDYGRHFAGWDPTTGRVMHKPNAAWEGGLTESKAAEIFGADFDRSRLGWHYGGVDSETGGILLTPPPLTAETAAWEGRLTGEKAAELGLADKWIGYEFDGYDAETGNFSLSQPLESWQVAWDGELDHDTAAATFGDDYDRDLLGSYFSAYNPETGAVDVIHPRTKPYWLGALTPEDSLKFFGTTKYAGLHYAGVTQELQPDGTTAEVVNFRRPPSDVEATEKNLPILFPDKSAAELDQYIGGRVVTDSDGNITVTPPETAATGQTETEYGLVWQYRDHRTGQTIGVFRSAAGDILQQPLPEYEVVAVTHDARGALATYRVTDPNTGEVSLQREAVEIPDGATDVHVADGQIFYTPPPPPPTYGDDLMYHNVVTPERYAEITAQNAEIAAGNEMRQADYLYDDNFANAAARQAAVTAITDDYGNPTGAGVPTELVERYGLSPDGITQTQYGALLEAVAQDSITAAAQDSIYTGPEVPAPVLPENQRRMYPALEDVDSRANRERWAAFHPDYLSREQAETQPLIQAPQPELPGEWPGYAESRQLHRIAAAGDTPAVWEWMAAEDALDRIDALDNRNAPIFSGGIRGGGDSGIVAAADTTPLRDIRDAALSDGIVSAASTPATGLQPTGGLDGVADQVGFDTLYDETRPLIIRNNPTETRDDGKTLAYGWNPLLTTASVTGGWTPPEGSLSRPIQGPADEYWVAWLMRPVGEGGLGLSREAALVYVADAYAKAQPTKADVRHGFISKNVGTITDATIATTAPLTIASIPAYGATAAGVVRGGAPVVGRLVTSAGRGGRLLIPNTAPRGGVIVGGQSFPYAGQWGGVGGFQSQLNPALVAGLRQGGVATLGGIKAAPGVVARAGRHIASDKPIYLPDKVYSTVGGGVARVTPAATYIGKEAAWETGFDVGVDYAIHRALGIPWDAGDSIQRGAITGGLEGLYSYGLERPRGGRYGGFGTAVSDSAISSALAEGTYGVATGAGPGDVILAYGSGGISGGAFYGGGRAWDSASHRFLPQLSFSSNVEASNPQALLRPDELNDPSGYFDFYHPKDIVPWEESPNMAVVSESLPRDLRYRGGNPRMWLFVTDPSTGEVTSIAVPIRSQAEFDAMLADIRGGRVLGTQQVPIQTSPTFVQKAIRGFPNPEPTRVVGDATIIIGGQGSAGGSRGTETLDIDGGRWDPGGLTAGSYTLSLQEKLSGAPVKPNPTSYAANEGAAAQPRALLTLTDTAAAETQTPVAIAPVEMDTLVTTPDWTTWQELTPEIPPATPTPTPPDGNNATLKPEFTAKPDGRGRLLLDAAPDGEESANTTTTTTPNPTETPAPDTITTPEDVTSPVTQPPGAAPETTTPETTTTPDGKTGLDHTPEITPPAKPDTTTKPGEPTRRVELPGAKTDITTTPETTIQPTVVPAPTFTTSPGAISAAAQTDLSLQTQTQPLTESVKAKAVATDVTTKPEQDPTPTPTLTIEGERKIKPPRRGRYPSKVSHTAEVKVETDLHTGHQTAELLGPAVIDLLNTEYSDRPAPKKRIAGRNALIEVDGQGKTSATPLRHSGRHKIQRPQPVQGGGKGKSSRRPNIPMPKLKAPGGIKPSR